MTRPRERRDETADVDRPSALTEDGDAEVGADVEDLHAP